MTDTTFTPAPSGEASILPASWSAASEVERETFKPMLIAKHGQNAVDMAIAKAAQPVGSTSGAGNMPVLGSATNRDRLNPTQASDIADALFNAASARIRANGVAKHLPETAIQAELDAYQATLEQTMKNEYGVVHTEAAPEVRSPDEIAFDEAFAPPANATDYSLKFSSQRLANIDIPTARALHDGFATAFHAMALPNANAQTLMDSILDARDEFVATPEAKRSDHWTTQRMFVERNLEAGHTWADVQKYVAVAVGKVPAGNVKDILSAGGLERGDVVLALYKHGQRLEEKARLVAARAKPKA